MTPPPEHLHALRRLEHSHRLITLIFGPVCVASGLAIGALAGWAVRGMVD